MKDIVQHHLEIRAFVSPRDVLLYLAADNRFRLLPKLLHGLALILEKIEYSYRTNVSDVPLLVRLMQPLLVLEGKSKVLITPAMTNKLVMLYKVCCRTDRCLRAYVSRHRTKGASISNVEAKTAPGTVSTAAISKKTSTEDVVTALMHQGTTESKKTMAASNQKTERTPQTSPDDNNGPFKRESPNSSENTLDSSTVEEKEREATSLLSNLAAASVALLKKKTTIMI